MGRPALSPVHYPLRGGQQYNLVVTFHSRQQEEWGVKDGSKEEVLSYFAGIHPRPRQMLDKPTSRRRWSTADREPVAKWGTERITLVGDAAHPVAQYMARGPVALEDAVTLGKALERCDGDAQQAFALYESVRIPARRVSSGLPARWGVSITPPGWSVRYVICCGKENRRRRFIAVSNGCTAGKKITVLSRVERFT